MRSLAQKDFDRPRAKILVIVDRGSESEAGNIRLTPHEIVDQTEVKELSQPTESDKAR
jgi:hypothetical protein